MPHFGKEGLRWYRVLLAQIVYIAVVFGTSKAQRSVPYREPLTHVASIRSVSCPQPCHCSSSTWNCDSAGLTEAPVGIPKTIVYVNLYGNKIKTLPRTIFMDMPLLRTIDLRNNQLESLSLGAFSDLPMLDTIYLSNNSISSIEVGSFENLPFLSVIRLEQNKLVGLKKNTFTKLPKLKTIRLNENPLTTIEPGSFNDLLALERIQMYKTNINTNIFGTWDPAIAKAERTFAPNCPSLREIDLGSMKLRSLYPSTFDDSGVLNTVRRIGEFQVWSSDLYECDLLGLSSIISDDYGSTLCLPTQGATLTDSPSRQEKGHLVDKNETSS